MRRLDLHLVRNGQRFRFARGTFAAHSVGPNCAMAVLVDGEHQGLAVGQMAYLPTGGPRNSVKVDLIDDDPEPPRAA